MNLGAPQVLFLIWIGCEIGYACAKHGQSKGRYDAPSSAIAYGLILALAWWGGLFS